MARGFQSMSIQQLSRFIAERTEYIKSLESILHVLVQAKPIDRGDVNKTVFGDDVIMANINNDWRTFDDVQGTMKELNRQRCTLLRAELIFEKMHPHTEMPSTDLPAHK